MREIKFCGKRLIDDKWVFGDLIQSCGEIAIATDVETDEIGLYIKRYDMVKSATISQYTGIKDANGTEVYEGDIVEFSLNVYNDEGVIMFEEFHTGYVHFSLGQWSVHIPKPHTNINLYDIDSRKLMIIGNVHDNSEFY